MKYRALGPITVEVAGQASKLGGLRQQMVLAVLLSRASQVVPQDALIDAVWSGEPPEAARATLQSYIYNLRRSVSSDVILRRGDGYLIEADATNFDVIDFSSKLQNGLGLVQTDPGTARTELVNALSLWFGAPYGGVDHIELDAEIQRLTEMRVNAIEARIQADLALGRDGELVGELEVLVREFPLRERFWGQLMVALYRSGRQAEALRAYQQARTRLADELGIDPGTELQQLEERVLAHDPTLLLERTPVSADGADPVSLRGYELRGVLGSTELGVAYRAYQHSVGREVVVKSIRPDLANDTTFVARFEREAQTIAALGHPHILPLHDYWRDPNGAYLVVPFMKGGSLAHSLRTQKWNLQPTIRLLEQIGSALGHAHRRGVIHGHLTASSVVLDDEGNAYLGDFGIGLAPRGGQPTVRTDVEAMGRLAIHLFTGTAPQEELDLNGLPTELSHVVERAVATDPGARYERITEFLRDLRRAAGVDVSAGSDLAEPPGEPIRNPFKGLRAFTELDAADFHGRSELVDDLLHGIVANRLVTIVGPSGSGKSSVVRAGVIPALRAGALPSSHQWLITDMFPGSYPFEELEAALTRVSVRGPGEIISELNEPNGLLRVCKRILPEESTLLLFIDQFEELFSLVRSEGVRRAFIDNLVAVADDERSRVRIVTTIRGDFLDRPLTYGDFAATIAPGLVTVGPPTRDGLAQSIAAPARSVGLELEPGLVAQVVADVDGQPGALPLLQYALTETFSAREGGALTIAAYEAAGGVTGAVGRRAEELFGDLSPVAQEVAREVFLRLVSVDETGVVTRKRARQNDLASLAVDRSALDTVLSAFARFRLLSFDRDPVTRGPTVEVAHEALLTTWSRLETWIDEARETLVMARRVGDSAHDWVSSNRDPSYLLRGSRLDDVEQWAAGAEVVLTGDEKDFIAASIDNRGREIAVARQRRQRALLALSLGLALVSLLAILAFVQRGAARQEATRARVRELASASLTHVEDNPELALLIAAEAFDTSVAARQEPLSEATSAMARIMIDWRLVGRFPMAPLMTPVASPDGTMIATAAEEDPTDVVIYQSDGAVMSVLAGPDAVVASNTTFHPDHDVVVVSYGIPGNGAFEPVPHGTPDVAVFRASTGERLNALETGTGGFSVAFNESGDLVAIGGPDGMVVSRWPDWDPVIRFPASVIGDTWFVDDSQLLTVTEQGISLLSVADGSADVTHVEDLSPLFSSVDAARSRIAYRAGDRIEVMDLTTTEVIFGLEVPGGLSVALSPDGKKLAYSGFDPTIYVHDLESNQEELRLGGIFGNVQSLAFVGSDRLLSYGEDALLWDVSPTAAKQLRGIALQVPQWGYFLSPDEQQLVYYVAANQGGPFHDDGDGVRLIDLTSGQETVVREGEAMTVLSGFRTVSEDFSLVGSLNHDGISTLRRLPSWDLVQQFEDCRSPLALSPDNVLVLISGWACLDAPPSELVLNARVVRAGSGDLAFELPVGYVYSAAFNPAGTLEGGRYLVETDQQTVRVWEVASGEMLGSFELPVDWQAFLNVGFDPTGRFAAVGTASGNVWVLDLNRLVQGQDVTDAMIFSRRAHTGAAPVPVMNGHGILATSAFTGSVRLWNVHSGDLLFEFEPDIGVPVVRFSPDGKRLLFPHGLSIRQFPVDPYELRALAGELLTRDFLPDECERYSRGPCN